jgi:hypothetical protein
VAARLNRSVGRSEERTCEHRLSGRLARGRWTYPGVAFAAAEPRPVPQAHPRLSVGVRFRGRFCMCVHRCALTLSVTFVLREEIPPYVSTLLDFNYWVIRIFEPPSGYIVRLTRKRFKHGKTSSVKIENKTVYFNSSFNPRGRHCVSCCRITLVRTDASYVAPLFDFITRAAQHGVRLHFDGGWSQASALFLLGRSDRDAAFCKALRAGVVA